MNFEHNLFRLALEGDPSSTYLSWRPLYRAMLAFFLKKNLPLQNRPSP